MDNKTLPVQIIDAINNEDCEAIVRLFSEYPEQKSAYTFIGGQTWLGYAAQKGKLGSAMALVGIGVDVNLGDKRENSGPLCSAAFNGYSEIVQYFLSVGAKLDVSASVCNPLFAAIVGRSPSIVKLLLEAGIDSTVRYSSKTMDNMDAVAFSLMRGERECAEIIALWNAEGDKEIAKAALEEAHEIAKINAG